MAHEAKVKEGNAAVVRQQNIALMWVDMHEARAHELGHAGLDGHVDEAELLGLVLDLAHPATLDPLHGEHARRPLRPRVLRKEARGCDPRLLPVPLKEKKGVRCLLVVVELLHDSRDRCVSNEADIVRAFPQKVPNVKQAFQALPIQHHLPRNTGSLHLHRHLLPLPGLRSVHLPERRRGHPGPEGAEEWPGRWVPAGERKAIRGQRPAVAQVLEDEPVGNLVSKGLVLRLQLAQLRGAVHADEVWALR
mmetsp:Transcript_103443/g.316640  ORF Transcript_103443/g.316640 Transcript_103443/m.316640 type:complete len:249 (-) Transcript_103443:522-1268(-)